MEINVNFVLFEELKENSDGGAEAHIVILRETKDVDSSLGSAASEFDSPQRFTLKRLLLDFAASRDREGPCLQ